MTATIFDSYFIEFRKADSVLWLKLYKSLVYFQHAQKLFQLRYFDWKLLSKVEVTFRPNSLMINIDAIEKVASYGISYITIRYKYLRKIN